MKNNKPQPPKSSPSAVKKPGGANPNNRSTNNPPAASAGRGNANTSTNQNQASRQPSRQNANNVRSPPPNNNNRNNNSNSRNPSPAPGLRRTQSNTQQSGSSTRANTNQTQNQNQNQRGISPKRTNSGARVNQNNANRNQNQNQNQTNKTSQTKNLNQNQNRNQNQNTNQKPGNRAPIFAKGQPQRQQSQSQTKGNSSAPARQSSNKNVTFGKKTTSPARQTSKQNVQSPARQNSKDKLKSPARQSSKEKVKSPARQNSRSGFASPKKQGSRENLRSPGPGPSTRNRDKSGGKNVDRRSRSAGSLGTRSRSTDSRGSFGVRSRNSSKDSRGSRGSSHGSKTSLRSNSSRRSNSSFRDRGRDRDRERGRDVRSPKRRSSSTSTDRRRRTGPYANREMRRTRSDPGDPYRYRGHRGHRSDYRGRDPSPYEYPYDYRHRYRYRDHSWSRSGSGGSFSSLKKPRSRSRSNSPTSRRSPRGSRSSRSSKSSKGSRVSFSKDTKKGESKRGKRSAHRLEKKKGQEELPPVKKLDHIVQAEVGARIWHGLRLNSAHHGNYIISPCFIIIMMGLMKVGAWGKTAYEIQKSMRLPKDDDTNIEAFETFIYSLQPTEGFDLKYGLGIYSSKALMFRTPYDEEREKDWPWIAKQKFNVRIKQYDYTKKKPNVIKDLNQWVQDLTDLKIKYAVSYDDVHNQPELFLVNFVYFKAVWKYVFDVDQTAMKPFYNYDNTFYNVEMMLTYINCRYAVYEDFKCRAVALPYKGDRYAMIIILPDQRTGLPDIEKLMYNLERKYHYRWKREIVPGPRDYYWRDYYKNYRMYKPFFMEIYYRLRHVHWLEVELPKFKVESKTNYVPVLQWLGTKAIFDTAKSQLGGIFEKTSKIAVDKIIQKVLIEVTEEGTGSTAVPTSRLGPTGRSFAKPVNAAFHVNHPFLFFIIDERYHAILMCGTKTNFQL